MLSVSYFALAEEDFKKKKPVQRVHNSWDFVSGEMSEIIIIEHNWKFVLVCDIFLP